MNRNSFLKKSILAAGTLAVPFAQAQVLKQQSKSAKLLNPSERKYWLKVLQQLSEPVLTNLSTGNLGTKMLFESVGNGQTHLYKNLEIFSRLFSGIAPWLSLQELPADEIQLQNRYRSLSLQCLEQGLSESSPDRFNFEKGQQPLVDAAFLAVGLLRAPNVWDSLPAPLKSKMIEAFKTTRKIQPYYNNWLLFSAAIEVFLFSIEEEWDRMRVDYAFKMHETWYKGDSYYGDGPAFHQDYYNSFVILPFMFELAKVLFNAEGKKGGKAIISENYYSKIKMRMSRHAEIQERLIGRDGTFPPLGRSLVYRYGAFHQLASACYHEVLPQMLPAGQAKSALSAAIYVSNEMPDTYREGWLQLGFAGHQPGISNEYNSNASAYLCSNALLPLGLPLSSSFWISQPEDWSAKKVWSGKEIPQDKALYE